MNRPSHRRIEDLLDIMARLRAPDGCPWDRKQTHASILSNLIEEAYEFVDAVENRDAANMKEELGDLLLQVVFQAQMAKEAGKFSFPDVVEVISEKLVRRHPHVFGESMVDTAEGVQKQWDEIKQREKAEKGGMVPEGTLAGIPKHLPALLKAEKIQKKASQAGFDWPDWRGPLDKVREEIRELEAEIPDADASSAEVGAPPVEMGVSPVDRLESEFGDLLFAVVSVGRKLKVDPEKALSRANRKFQDRYAKMEALAKAEGRWQEWETLSLEEKDVYWERVKREEKCGQ